VADDGSQRRKPDFRTALEDVKALAIVLAMEAESVLGRRTARFLGVLVLFAVVVGTLLALLDWYISPSGAEQKQALVVTLAQVLGARHFYRASTSPGAPYRSIARGRSQSASRGLSISLGQPTITGTNCSRSG
jgi:hypothetical protein